MRRSLVLLAAMVTGVLLASGLALAAEVGEAEPNDSIAQAQNLDASFDLSENADIVDSTGVRHATVNGSGDATVDGLDNDTLDYYSFTVPAGDPVRVILDIDHTTYVPPPDLPLDTDIYDSWIELYDSSGALLELSDQDGLDPGSTDTVHDSAIVTTLAPGTYYVAVGRFASNIVDDCCVERFMAAVPDTATYQLHVSVGNPDPDTTSPPDTTPPRVESVFPADFQADVATPANNVFATFSEQVQGVTKSTFKLERVVVNKKGVEKLRHIPAQVSTQLIGPGPCRCILVQVTEATLNPVNDLQSGKYQVTITNKVTDMAGNPLDQDSGQAGNQPMVWTFTVGSPPV